MRAEYILHRPVPQGFAILGTVEADSYDEARTLGRVMHGGTVLAAHSKIAPPPVLQAGRRVDLRADAGEVATLSTYYIRAHARHRRNS